MSVANVGWAQLEKLDAHQLRERCQDLHAEIDRLRAFEASHAGRNHTQVDVLNWVRDTFGQQFLNDRERALRFIEEAIELVQAIGLEPSDVADVAAHVFGRPVGEYVQEFGGVMITLEAMGAHLGVDVDTQANREWIRVNGIGQDHFDAAVKRKTDAGVCHALSEGQL